MTGSHTTRRMRTWSFSHPVLFKVQKSQHLRVILQKLTICSSAGPSSNTLVILSSSFAFVGLMMGTEGLLLTAHCEMDKSENVTRPQKTGLIIFSNSIFYVKWLLRWRSSPDACPKLQLVHIILCNHCCARASKLHVQRRKSPRQSLTTKPNLFAQRIAVVCKTRAKYLKHFFSLYNCCGRL